MNLNDFFSQRGSLMILSVHIFLLLLAIEFIRHPRLGSQVVALPLNSAGSNDTATDDLLPFNVKNQLVDRNVSSCHFNKTTRQLYCNRSLDLMYLKLLRDELIEDLIVDRFIADSSSPRNISSHEKWYLTAADTYRKLTGQVQLKNTGLQINFILNILSGKNELGEYVIEGEAFSTKLIKITKSLRGSLSLSNASKNRIVVSLTVKTLDTGDSELVLSTNLTYSQGSSVKPYDDWIAYGMVRSDLIGENKTAYFAGLIKTKIKQRECKFWGEINLTKGNLLWSVEGKASSPQDKQITIPRAAFQDMNVRNIVFKNSDFFHDFHKNVFQGLKGVEMVSFLSSKLEVMPKMNDLFQPLTDLREIHIEDCMTRNLKFGIKSNATFKNLTKISFKGSGPLILHEMSFYWLQKSNVTYLNLRNSYIVLPPKSRSVLKGVSHSLQYLDLSYVNLKNDTDLTVILEGLRIVNLTAEGLQLKKIPTVAISKVKSTLKYLSLKGNNFEKALEKNIFNTIFNFPLMISLTELDLSDCQINYLERGAFDHLPNLRVLHMARNNLENLQDGWILTFPKIVRLDLSSNRPKPHVLYVEANNVDTTLNLSVLNQLQVLNLSNSVFHDPITLIKSIGGNLKELSLRNSNLRNLPADIFDNLTRLESLDISQNRNFKSVQTFSIDLFRNLKSLKTLNMRDCRVNTSFMYRSLNAIEDPVSLLLSYDYDNSNNETILTNLENLDLSYNNIKSIDYVMFQIFPKLKILSLSGNGITTWKSGTFDFSKNLESVYLDENKIEMITPEMKIDLLKFKYLKLGNNPFICGPYVYEFVDIIKRMEPKPGRISSDIFHPDRDRKKSNMSQENESGMRAIQEEEPVKTVILDWSQYNYVCFSRTSGKFVPFVLVEETFESTGLPGLHENVYLWILVAIILGVIFTLGIFCWKLMDIHLITKVVRNAVALSFLTRRSKEPEKYDYNVFVSYSDKDRQWVIDHLIHRLQKNGDVKVCLHERDFQVGLSILENIISCIDSSRHILLVLSTAFLKSHWCQYEMHLAQHRLLEKGRDQLILILLEDIPLIKRPRVLRYLMMTKTYLEWPVHSKNQSDVELFWNRLLKALKM